MTAACIRRGSCWETGRIGNRPYSLFRRLDPLRALGRGVRLGPRLLHTVHMLDGRMPMHGRGIRSRLGPPAEGGQHRPGQGPLCGRSSMTRRSRASRPTTLRLHHRGLHAGDSRPRSLRRRRSGRCDRRVTAVVAPQVKNRERLRSPNDSGGGMAAPRTHLAVGRRGFRHKATRMPLLNSH